jgi:hypothetical protein
VRQNARSWEYHFASAFYNVTVSCDVSFSVHLAQVSQSLKEAVNGCDWQVFGNRAKVYENQNDSTAEQPYLRT